MFEEAKIGDKIWSEIHGPCKIAEIKDGDLYPIILSIPFGEFESCTLCGRQCHGDLKPSYFWSEPKYEIPPMPKRKVKKTLEVWVNIYPDGPADAYHKSRWGADTWGVNRTACVRCVGEYEVEE